jgi:molybdopterin synthase sulfur carrier subunit
VSLWKAARGYAISTRLSLLTIRHLRALAHVKGEVTVEVAGTVCILSVLDALEAKYPMLEGTIRDHGTRQRRPFLRFFACAENWSHDLLDKPLPEAVAHGKEPLLVTGAIRRRVKRVPGRQA